MPLKTAKCKLKERQYVRCCVPGCHRFKRNFKNLYFHLLPKNKVVVQQWLDRIENSELAKKPLTNVRVCGRHFEKNAFLDSRNRVLKSDAVPVLYMPSLKRERKCAGAFYVVNNCLTAKLFTEPTHLHASCVSEDQRQVKADLPHTIFNRFATELHDFRKICRICLVQAEELTSVDCEFIRNMLVFCPTFTFTENLAYPRQICAPCLSELEIAYNFSRKYEQSNVVLQNCAGKSKTAADLTYSEQAKLNYVPKGRGRSTSIDRGFDYLFTSAELQSSDSNVLVSKETGRNTRDKKNNYGIEKSSRPEKSAVRNSSNAEKSDIKSSSRTERKLATENGLRVKKKADIKNSSITKKKNAKENGSSKQLQTTAENKTTKTDNNSTRHNSFITENKFANQIPPTKIAFCRESNCVKTTSAGKNHSNPRKMTASNNNFVYFQHVSRKRKLNETQQVCVNRPCVAVVPMQKTENPKFVEEKIAQITESVIRKNKVTFKEKEHVNNRQEEIKPPLRDCSKNTMNDSKTVKSMTRKNKVTFKEKEHVNSRQDEIKPTLRDCSKSTTNDSKTVEDKSNTVEQNSNTFADNSRTGGGWPMNVVEIPQTFEDAQGDVEGNRKIPEKIANAVEYPVIKKERIYRKQNRTSNRLKIRKKFVQNKSENAIPEAENNTYKCSILNTIVKPGYKVQKDFNKPADILPVNSETYTDNNNESLKTCEEIFTNSSPDKFNFKTEIETVVVTESDASCLENQSDLTDTNLEICRSKFSTTKRSQNDANSTEASNSIGREQEIAKTVDQCNGVNLNMPILIIDDDELNRFVDVRVDLSQENLTKSRQRSQSILEELLKSNIREKHLKCSIRNDREECGSHKNSCEKVKFGVNAVNCVINPAETNSLAASGDMEIKSCKIRKLNESVFSVKEGKDEKLSDDNCSLDISSEMSQPVNSAVDQNQTDRCTWSEDSILENANRLSEELIPDHAKCNLVEDSDETESSETDSNEENQQDEITSYTDLNCGFIQDISISKKNASTATYSIGNENLLEEHNGKTDIGSENEKNAALNEARNVEESMSAEILQFLNEFVIIPRQNPKTDVSSTTVLPSDTDASVPTQQERDLRTESATLLYATADLSQQAIDPFINSDVMLSSEQNLFSDSLRLDTVDVGDEIPLYDSFVQSTDNIINLQYNSVFGGQLIGSEVELSSENSDIDVDADANADVEGLQTEATEILNTPIQFEFPTDKTRGQRYFDLAGIPEEHRLFWTTESTPSQYGREEISNNNTRRSATIVASEENESSEYFLVEKNEGEYTSTWLSIKQTDNFQDKFSTELDDTIMPNLQCVISKTNGSSEEHFTITGMSPEETGIEETPLQTDHAGSDFVNSYAQSNVINLDVPTAKIQIPPTSTDLPTSKLQVLSLPTRNRIRVVLTPKSVLPQIKLAHKCNVCNEGFNTIFKLNCHLINTKHIAAMTCKFCRQTVPIDSYKAHLSQHNSEKTFCCEFCGIICSSINAFTKHRGSHICECDNQDKSLFQLEEHITVHEQQTPSVCQFCSKVFRDRTSKATHVISKTCQKTKEKYQCPTCKRQFQRKDMFKTHIKMHAKV